MSSEAQTIQAIPGQIKNLQRGFAASQRLSMEEQYKLRVKHINAAMKMFKDHEQEWQDALGKDLRSNRLLKLFELENTYREGNCMLKHLKQWMQPNRMLFTFPGRATIYKEPYGVVLIFSPWYA